MKTAEEGCEFWTPYTTLVAICLATGFACGYPGAEIATKISTLFPLVDCGLMGLILGIVFAWDFSQDHNLFKDTRAEVIVASISLAISHAFGIGLGGGTRRLAAIVLIGTMASGCLFSAICIGLVITKRRIAERLHRLVERSRRHPRHHRHA